MTATSAPESTSVAIVGAGILGLAHAWSARQRGHRVTVFERDRRASGASVRNFGMVWPIGQAGGPLAEVARLSRERWLQAAAAARVWVTTCGSLHLAHHEDELQVLREFEELAPQHGHACELLSPAEVSQRTPAANAEGLRGGLWSAIELGVNPRQASAALAGWLSTQGVELAFGRAVTVVEPRGDCQVRLRLAGERADRVFDRVVVCSGADFETLIPDHFAESGMRRCKLQMLRTRPQSGGWRLGTHLASGLTLRHYANFTCCPTLGEVRRRIAAEAPELDEHGIHVMASQDDEGHVILGDSHEYGDRVTPFDSEEINALMLRELRKVFVLPDWSIDQAWHGVYAKRDAGPDEEPVHESSPFPGAYICTGVGGAGMTLSFGLAERAWRAWTSR